MINPFLAGVHTQLRVSAVTPLALVSAILGPMAYGIVVVSNGSGADLGITVGIAAAGIWDTALTSALLAVLEERRNRTLQLLVTAPAPMTWPLLGRVVGAALQGLAAAPLTFVAVGLIWRIPPLGDPTILIGSLVLTLLGSAAMSAFLIGFLVRYRFFAGMVNGFFDLVTFLCGMFVPVTALHPAGRQIAELLAPTWGMTAVRAQSYTALGTGFLVLLCWLLAAAGYLTLAERRVRKISAAFFA